MRIIDLDFYADRSGTIFLGYAGEHLSTVLNFHMPAEFSKDNCLYLVNFEKDDGQVLGGSTPQESQTVGEPTADSLIAFRADRDSNIVKYYVPNTVVGATAHTGKFQLSVYGLDVTNNNYKLLGYSTQFSYVIDNAINIGTSINFSEDFIAALDDLSSAIANIGSFSELSQEYTDLVDRISAVLNNIEDNYETISNRSDDEIDYDNISASNISEEDKQKYINLYRIKELVIKIKNKISANTTNINNLSTKVGSDSFDDSTKINNVVPSNVMDALKKISTALTSLNNDKINKTDAIKYISTSTLNDCVEPGTIYRYTETVNGNLNGLETGDYTIIPSYIAGTGKLAQYIFSTTGAIYYRCRTLENGSYVYTIEKLVTRQEFSALNDIVTNASDNFGTVKTQNAPIASFGNYTNGLAVGNVGEKVTRGTQVYWYRYEIDAKSFTNYKIKYYGVKNPNVSDYIIVVDKNDIILAKHGESQSAAGYATKTFTTPANTCKIIVNSGSGTETPQGMYITPIDLQKQVNNTSVTMDGKISIPNSELTPSDSGTGFLTDDGFGNVYVNTNANWNWKKFAVISGVYFVSTVKAANASLTFDYVYVTDSSGLIKSSYIHPSSGGGRVSDEKIEVLENGYVYVQTFGAAQTSEMKCKDSTYIFDELLRKNNEFESYEKNVFGGYALPTFSSSENNLTVKVPNNGVFVCEQGSSNNAFKYITPTQNTFSLNNLQLLVLNKSTNDIEIIHQSTFLNNPGSYIVLVWNYYGQVRGQWYLYYIAQQLNSGYHTMMQEVTNKYISRQGKFYVDGIHENTVDAIKYAKSKGYNHIRVSVCFTSDGYGVLSHSNELADLQGAERKDGEPISTETISGMTITELDADYEYYGESFARLDDAVALCKQINMELTLEIKSSFNGSQQKSIDVLRAYGMNKHTFWSCSSISQINSIVSIDNKANVAYIVHLSSISDVDSLYAVNTTGEKRLDIYSNDTYDATIWAYARSKDITIKYGSVYNINTAVAMAPYCDYLECADIEYPALAIYQKTS